MSDILIKKEHKRLNDWDASTWDGQVIEDKKVWASRRENYKSRENYGLSRRAKDNWDEIDWKKK